MKDNVKSRTEVEDEKVVCEQKPEVKTLQDWSKQQICDSRCEDPPKTSSYKELEESKPNTETANLTFCSASERAADVSVYEQYLLYMAQLDRLRQGRRAHPSGNHGNEADNVKDGETVGQTTSPANCCEMTPSSSTQRFKHQQRREAARTSTATEPMMASNKAGDITHNPKTPKATAKQSPDVVMKRLELRQRTTRSNHLALCEEVIKIPVEHGTSTDDDITGLPLHHLKIYQEPESAGTSQHRLITPLNPALKVKTGLCRPENRTGYADGQSGAARRPDVPQRFWEKSSLCWSTLIHGEPADVAVFNQWLCLPDEVWLSVLSLLPHNHLSTVAQVCHRMHQLANDHTLWTVVERRNGALTEQWLSWLGVRRPRSVSLYRCSSPSISTHALETFFSLCTASLEKFNVTSCIGSGLHGNLLLRLIGLQAVSDGLMDRLLQQCPGLQSLCLASCPGVSDLTLNSICSHTPYIRLAVLADRCHEHLHTVKLSFCHISPENILRLCRHCKKLKVLHLYGCADIPSEREIREVHESVKVDPLP
ncbi:unnamed protein product [Boreogadus saida]